MLTIRHFFINSFIFIVTFDVSLRGEPSNGGGRMIYSSLEPPRRGDSNGSKFIPIQSLGAEIINETACGAVSVNEKCRSINVSSNSEPSSGHVGMQLTSFDASQRDDSNEL
jgi:hypothetical protein